MQIEYNEARFFGWDAAFIIQRFYFQYQTDALPHGESIQSFCLKNNVPYNIFSKWYKDTRKQIVERTGDEKVYRIDWKDVVLLLENPIVKTLKIR